MQSFTLRTKFLVILLSGILIFSVACQEESKSELPTIVVTTNIIYDVVKNVVGNEAEIISLMGAGVDPHYFKASQGDIKKLQSADIIIYNGLSLEGKMAEILEKLSKNKPVIGFGSFANKDRLRQVSGSESVTDPHIWFDTKLWLDCLGGVTKAIDKTDMGIEGLDGRYQRYRNKILAESVKLQEYTNENLSQEKRVLVTSHDAFYYFGNYFNFEVKSLQGISTVSEYGIKDVTELVSYLIENKIEAVFAESSVSSKALMSIIEGCKQKGHNVKIGGELFSDALGEPGGEGGTYSNMLDHNVKTIVEGLK